MSGAERAARVWRHRERVELEAALLFEELARELAATGHAELARRTLTAAADEQRHALRCRALVEMLSGIDALPPEKPRQLALGSPSLSRRDRVLYAAVAIGCITESLSCALLLELRSAAIHPLTVDTVEEILRDEIEHARIGWAVLAAEASVRDVSWLAPHVKAMLSAAVDDDVMPMTGYDELVGFGVLPRARVYGLVAETHAKVIAPGLERFGIHA